MVVDDDVLSSQPKFGAKRKAEVGVLVAEVDLVDLVDLLKLLGLQRIGTAAGRSLAGTWEYATHG